MANTTGAKSITENRPKRLENDLKRLVCRGGTRRLLSKAEGLRKALIEPLRKGFGNEGAIVGDQAIHVGRMGVYAADVYARGKPSPSVGRACRLRESRHSCS